MRRRFVDWLSVVVDVVVLIPDGRRSGRKDGLASWNTECGQLDFDLIS